MPYEIIKDFVDNVSNASDDALGPTQAPLSGGGGLQFPSDLGSRAVHFQVKTRDREKQRIGTRGKDGALIALPIPANLSTGYGAVYGQQGLGVLGAEAQRIASSGANAGQALVDVRENGITALSEQAKAIAASASQEVAGVLGAALGKTVGTSVGIGLTTAGLAGIGVGALRGAGLAVNPHLAVLFEGMNFRNHTFNYKFAARDAGESASLADIITTFKSAMHPTTQGLAFFQYPDEFKISFPQDTYLFKIGNSVLSSFNIDYTPDGASYFHQNGAPVSVSLSLQFTELDILTKEEINEGR